MSLASVTKSIREWTTENLLDGARAVDLNALCGKYFLLLEYEKGEGVQPPDGFSLVLVNIERRSSNSNILMFSFQAIPRDSKKQRIEWTAKAFYEKDFLQGRNPLLPMAKFRYQVKSEDETLPLYSKNRIDLRFVKRDNAESNKYRWILLTHPRIKQAWLLFQYSALFTSIDEKETREVIETYAQEEAGLIGGVKPISNVIEPSVFVPGSTTTAIVVGGGVAGLAAFAISRAFQNQVNRSDTTTTNSSTDSSEGPLASSIDVSFFQNVTSQFQGIQQRFQQFLVDLQYLISVDNGILPTRYRQIDARGKIDEYKTILNQQIIDVQGFQNILFSGTLSMEMASLFVNELTIQEALIVQQQLETAELQVRSILALQGNLYVERNVHLLSGNVLLQGGLETSTNIVAPLGLLDSTSPLEITYKIETPEVKSVSTIFQVTSPSDSLKIEAPIITIGKTTGTFVQEVTWDTPYIYVYRDHLSTEENIPLVEHQRSELPIFNVGGTIETAQGSGLLYRYQGKIHAAVEVDDGFWRLRVPSGKKIRLNQSLTYEEEPYFQTIRVKDTFDGVAKQNLINAPLTGDVSTIPKNLVSIQQLGTMTRADAIKAMDKWSEARDDLIPSTLILRSDDGSIDCNVRGTIEGDLTNGIAKESKESQISSVSTVFSGSVNGDCSGTMFNIRVNRIGDFPGVLAAQAIQNTPLSNSTDSSWVIRNELNQTYVQNLICNKLYIQSRAVCNINKVRSSCFSSYFSAAQALLYDENQPFASTSFVSVIDFLSTIVDVIEIPHAPFVLILTNHSYSIIDIQSNKIIVSQEIEESSAVQVKEISKNRWVLLFHLLTNQSYVIVLDSETLQSITDGVVFPEKGILSLNGEYVFMKSTFEVYAIDGTKVFDSIMNEPPLGCELSIVGDSLLACYQSSYIDIIEWKTTERIQPSNVLYHYTTDATILSIQWNPIVPGFILVHEQGLGKQYIKLWASTFNVSVLLYESTKQIYAYRWAPNSQSIIVAHSDLIVWIPTTEGIPQKELNVNLYERVNFLWIPTYPSSFFFNNQSILCRVDLASAYLYHPIQRQNSSISFLSEWNGERICLRDANLLKIAFLNATSPIYFSLRVFLEASFQNRDEKEAPYQLTLQAIIDPQNGIRILSGETRALGKKGIIVPVGVSANQNESNSDWNMSTSVVLNPKSKASFFVQTRSTSKIDLLLVS